jgi:hypothetical protein
MKSKVKIQTNKTKLDVCLRQSLVLRLNLNVSLVVLSWPLFIGGQVLRIRLGSMQIHRIWWFTSRFSYSNTIQFDFYLGPIFLWAFTRIHLRGTNITRLDSHTLVRRPVLVHNTGSERRHGSKAWRRRRWCCQDEFLLQRPAAFELWACDASYRWSWSGSWSWRRGCPWARSGSTGEGDSAWMST